MTAKAEGDKTTRVYDEQASSYEKRWSAYLAHTHEAFLRNINIDKRDAILDLSGGTGLLAQKLIKQNYSFEKLVINDPSANMLGIARNRLQGHPRVHFTNQKAEEIELENTTFSAIFCLNSFHFYRKQLKVLDHCYRMLKPNGRLYVLDWNRAGLFRLINLIISLSAREHIDTKSLKEFEEILVSKRFEVQETKTWHWRYWNFFFGTALKTDR